MARGTGIALKATQWVLTALEFCCAASILSITSYILAILLSNNLAVAPSTRAIEGIAGAAVFYTVCGLLLLCCLAGVPFFAVLAILLDLAFIGAFAYVASQNRASAGTCSGFVVTVFGAGDANSDGVVTTSDGIAVFLPSLRLACQLQTACFSIAIVVMYAPPLLLPPLLLLTRINIPFPLTASSYFSPPSSRSRSGTTAAPSAPSGPHPPTTTQLAPPTPITGTTQSRGASLSSAASLLRLRSCSTQTRYRCMSRPLT
jgi:hypothetical protein